MADFAWWLALPLVAQGTGDVRTHAGRRNLHRLWHTPLRGDATGQPALGWRCGTGRAGGVVAPVVGMGAIMALRLITVLVILGAIAITWYLVEAGFVHVQVP